MTTHLAPPPPVARLRAFTPAVRLFSTGEVLWRIHDTRGEHVLPWNELRHYGPVPTCRFEPHDPPTGPDKPDGVSYLSPDVATALAERFQQTRPVINTLRGAPYLTASSMTRPLRLLDLTGTWPLLAGASYVLNTGPHDITSLWAGRIADAWPDLDGLWSTSSMSGRPCVTLFTPAASAVAAAPSWSEPLAHPGLLPVVAAAAASIGFSLIV